MRKDKPKYRQIIDAAVIVIAQNGYHQAQVSKIAKQAGVADGTIYLYFQNKEDILISLFKEKMGNFVETLKSKLTGFSTAAEKIYILIETHLKMMTDEPNLAIVLQLELRQTSNELRSRINDIMKDYLMIIDSLLEEGMENGEFQKTLEVRLARKVIFGAMDQIVTAWVMKGQKYDLAALAPDVHKLLINGIGSQSNQAGK